MRLLMILAVGLLLTNPVHATIITGGTPEARTTARTIIINNNIEQIVYRIDLQPYNHKYYDAYAWYKPRRISIYQQTWQRENYITILKHELGHLICEEQRLNRYNYEHNEQCADRQGEQLR